ncbi:MAG: tyrosine decarboxylase MfnA [Methanobacteriaceae archaeon]|nr:tyrosine decarboxylase MfnA [Methanobacteriaceae archaeon]
MDKQGLSREEVFQELQGYQKQDLTHRSGKILGSMCTCPHEVGRDAYSMFLESNLGDPGLFTGTQRLENESIDIIGSFLGLNKVFGHIITGGTEANIMAMRAARNYSGIKNPEIIVPKSAHFSFKKASDMLCLKIKEAELDSNYKMDLGSVEELLSDKTVAVVGVAGTTELGKIDPIQDLSKLCQERNIYLHVDAAFGGFIIPFLKELDYDLPNFDFSLDGVCSITIDPHKMGLAPIPTGCILFRDEKYLDVMSIETPYLTEKRQSTIVGTRSGASAAATWALLKYMGKEGYMALAKKCMEITKTLVHGIRELGLELITEPELNIVAFKSKKMSIDELAQKLNDREWAVSISSYPRAIRIIVMPHINKEHINKFLADLKQITVNY